jgi:pyruvate/2-oxoglutarate dehydrogenase complex dihydrolipoamide dehydrogenase (E3) component
MKGRCCARGSSARASAGGAFTDTACNDFEIVAANLLDGEQRKVSAHIPGHALYINPPLGRVGMTEIEARATGRKLLVGHRAMEHVGRAIEMDETQVFMNAGVSYQVLQRAVPIHPPFWS